VSPFCQAWLSISVTDVNNSVTVVIKSADRASSFVVSCRQIIAATKIPAEVGQAAPPMTFTPKSLSHGWAEDCKDLFVRYS